MAFTPAARAPRRSVIDLPDQPDFGFTADDWSPSDLVRLQEIFGYTGDDVERVLAPMARRGEGFDKRLPQKGGSALRTRLGAAGTRRGDDRPIVTLPSPVLTERQFHTIEQLPALRATTLPLIFPVSAGPHGAELAIRAIVRAAVDAVAQGSSLIILSDRTVDASWAPVSALSATTAVHEHLIEHGLRSEASIVVDTGDVREADQLASLLARGASAVLPYLAYHAVAMMPDIRSDLGVERYRRGLEVELLAIARHLGLSPFSGILDGQHFAVGTISDIEGRHESPARSRKAAARALARHQAAFDGSNGPARLALAYVF